MNVTATVRSAYRATLALLASFAMAATLLVAGSGTANAAPANCVNDRVGWGVLKCDVWSPAMNRNIPVQIKPAARGGNAALYLLDGLRAQEHSNAWLTDVNAAQVYDGTNITLVMPVGGQSSFYLDWAREAKPGLNYQWETFLTQELPVYLEREFGIARNNNAIAGLSMGGTAALNLAAKNPQQFRAVLSFSGYPTTNFPGGYTMMSASMLDAGSFDINRMYGSALAPARFENDPNINIGGLRNTKVYVSAAPGAPTHADAQLPPDQLLPGMALEAASNASTRMFGFNAKLQGIDITEHYPPHGVHNWALWNRELHHTKNFVLDVMNAH